MTNDLPKFKAATVQAAPVFLDSTATAQKVVRYMQQAAEKGCSLIAFPEVFISAYPYWNWVMSPIKGSKWYEKLYKSAVVLDGPELSLIKKAAAEFKINVVVGLNERGQSLGEIYNTNAIISEKGELLGAHRKLVPTWAEKLSWTSGDGSSLKVYPTSVGPLGTLACGENTNTLARFTLLAQGELVHIANYISLPVAPPDYNMAEAIRIRAAAHSFEGKLFTIVSCSTIAPEVIDMLKADAPDIEELFQRKQSAFSGFIGPNGATLSEPLIDDEGLLVAEIDLNLCIQPKQMHDILGHYNRFDIFELRVNTAPQKKIHFVEPAQKENIYGKEI